MKGLKKTLQEVSHGFRPLVAMISQAVIVMADADGGGGSARRRRPWRKPREAKGPPELSSDSAMISPLEYSSRLASGVLGEETGHHHQQATVPVPMDTSEHVQIAVASSSSSSVGARGTKRNREEPSKKHHDRRGGEQVDTGGGGGGGDRGGRGGVKSTDGDGIRDDGIKFLDIDGSVMEGGGQILRNAMTYSCLLHRPIHITRIRAGRDKPGLRPQHLKGIQLIAELCNGRLKGDNPESSDVTFDPGDIKGGNYTVDTQTAGSIVLLLQSALPCLLFSPTDTTLVLQGGTNADMAPPIDYMMRVFTPIVKKSGIKFDLSLIRKGFYPRGKGEVHITVPPVTSLSPVRMVERGEIVDITVEVFTAGAVRPKVGQQMAGAAKQYLSQKLSSVNISVHTIHLTEREAYSNGSGVMVVAKTTTGCVLGGSANGRRGEEPHVTGRKAAEELVRNLEHGGCVDEHLQDQLIVFMSLCEGESEVRTGPVTLHTRTVIHVAELMTKAQFTVTPLDHTHSNIIKCKGVGFSK